MCGAFPPEYLLVEAAPCCSYALFGVSSQDGNVLRRYTYFN